MIDVSSFEWSKICPVCQAPLKRFSLSAAYSCSKIGFEHFEVNAGDEYDHRVKVVVWSRFLEWWNKDFFSAEELDDELKRALKLMAFK